MSTAYQTRLLNCNRRTSPVGGTRDGAFQHFSVQSSEESGKNRGSVRRFTGRHRLRQAVPLTLKEQSLGNFAVAEAEKPAIPIKRVDCEQRTEDNSTGDTGGDAGGSWLCLTGRPSPGASLESESKLRFRPAHVAS